ncbi:MAG: ABC transporter permease, partial [Gaiellales bacterium]
GLGFSFDTRTSVRDEIVDRAPRTLFLVAGAAVLWLVVGVGVGVISAVRRRSLVDRASMGLALVGLSTPGFWLGFMALFVFWEKLGWLPGTGYVPLSEGVGDWFAHLVLPWTVLAFSFAAVYARMSRGALLEAMGQDYIRTARAKGLSERRVVLRHGLRSGLNPIVTMVGLDIALLVGGAVVTERVFNLQGLGDLGVSSARTEDFPVALGVVLVGTLAVVVMSALVDVAHRMLDPRVRYE